LPGLREQMDATVSETRVRSATWEDLERHFGSGGLSFGIPVRPLSDAPSPPQAEQPPAEEEQSSNA
jgi:hypothetical protein